MSFFSGWIGELRLSKGARYEGERFAPEGAGAVALWVRYTSRASRHRTAIRIYGHAVARPFEGLQHRLAGTGRLH